MPPLRPLLVCTILLALGAGAHAEPTLRAGATKQSIVPPHPTKMGGYFDRLDNFTGVSTPVYARALVCGNGEHTQALVSLDLIGVSDPLVKLARDKVAAETSIPAKNVLICAVHDHSAPTGFVGMSLAGEADEDTALTEFLISTIAAVVKEAQAAMRPSRLGFAYGRLEGITRNRQQNNNEVVDPELGVLKVEAADSREIIGILCNFTGHPVILGSNNLLLSSEYPGRAAAVIEEVLGGVAVFTQGACGDVTMHRSGDPFEEIKRLGNIVAGEAIKTAGLITPSDDTALVSAVQAVTVEPRVLPSLAEAQERLESLQQALGKAKNGGETEAKTRRLEREADAAETTLNVVKLAQARPGLVDEACHTSVQVMQWGPLIVVGMPGELFVEYQLEMKQRVRQATGHPLMVAGYANDYIGYIVTPRAVHTGGYEQAIARVSHTAGRTLVEAAMTLAEAGMKKEE
ncbi:MAG: neutral/alkaline non-lysosomal ceramidase N-terminal domain-containing protein [Candidatus Hydrogenedentes bacterium]|nr:neutral/alkaline non-lysosomal ceramidase N-terminal domain-containing protein [Candidatus Hydrogenedentota bacterium]